MSQSFYRSSTTIPGNTSVTEKRTVITSSSGGSTSLSPGLDDDSSMYYRSSISPRHTTVTRRSVSPIRTSRTVEITSGYSSAPHIPLGASVNVAATGVNSFKNTREREKKDMQDLNERFASYIEKVRFLEAQNKKLGAELEQLRSHWGKETSNIKQMYETELAEARKLIDDTNKEKARLQLRVGQLEEQLDDAMRQLDEAKKWRSQDRETINKLNQQVSELEGEIRMLRRSNESLDTERQRDKSTIARLQDELEKLRIDLSNETIARLDAENKYQTLLEEIEFLKSVHEQELKELSALAYRDTTAENREFWKNELSQAIKDIQQEYDIKVDQIRGEMETFYNLKVQEFRTGATKQNMEVTHAREETKKLQKQLTDSRGRLADLEARNAQLERQYQELLRELEQKEHDHVLETNELKEEMNKLRAEMEGMLVELQTLMDAKLSLELEIAAYRKLLEGEETRIPLRNSFRHSYTPFSTSTTKSDTHGLPYGAAPSSRYTYLSSRGRDSPVVSASKIKPSTPLTPPDKSKTAVEDDSFTRTVASSQESAPVQHSADEDSATNVTKDPAASLQTAKEDDTDTTGQDEESVDSKEQDQEEEDEGETEKTADEDAQEKTDSQVSEADAQEDEPLSKSDKGDKIADHEEAESKSSLTEEPVEETVMKSEAAEQTESQLLRQVEAMIIPHKEEPIQMETQQETEEEATKQSGEQSEVQEKILEDRHEQTETARDVVEQSPEQTRSQEDDMKADREDGLGPEEQEQTGTKKDFAEEMGIQDGVKGESEIQESAKEKVVEESAEETIVQEEIQQVSMAPVEAAQEAIVESEAHEEFKDETDSRETAPEDMQRADHSQDALGESQTFEHTQEENRVLDQQSAESTEQSISDRQEPRSETTHESEKQVSVREELAKTEQEEIESNEGRQRKEEPEKEIQETKEEQKESSHIEESATAEEEVEPMSQEPARVEEAPVEEQSQATETGTEQLGQQDQISQISQENEKTSDKILDVDRETVELVYTEVQKGEIEGEIIRESHLESHQMSMKCEEPSHDKELEAETSKANVTDVQDTLTSQSKEETEIIEETVTDKKDQSETHEEVLEGSQEQTEFQEPTIQQESSESVGKTKPEQGQTDVSEEQTKDFDQDSEDPKETAEVQQREILSDEKKTESEVKLESYEHADNVKESSEEMSLEKDEQIAIHREITKIIETSKDHVLAETQEKSADATQKDGDQAGSVVKEEIIERQTGAVVEAASQDKDIEDATPVELQGPDNESLTEKVEDELDVHDTEPAPDAKDVEDTEQIHSKDEHEREDAIKDRRACNETSLPGETETTDKKASKASDGKDEKASTESLGDQEAIQTKGDVTDVVTTTSTLEIAPEMPPDRATESEETTVVPEVAEVSQSQTEDEDERKISDAVTPVISERDGFTSEILETAGSSEISQETSTDRQDGKPSDIQLEQTLSSLKTVDSEKDQPATSPTPAVEDVIQRQDARDFKKSLSFPASGVDEEDEEEEKVVDIDKLRQDISNLEGGPSPSDASEISKSVSDSEIKSEMKSASLVQMDQSAQKSPAKDISAESSQEVDKDVKMEATELPSTTGPGKEVEEGSDVTAGLPLTTTEDKEHCLPDQQAVEEVPAGEGQHFDHEQGGLDSDVGKPGVDVDDSVTTGPKSLETVGESQGLIETEDKPPDDTALEEVIEQDEGRAAGHSSASDTVTVTQSTKKLAEESNAVEQSSSVTEAATSVSYAHTVTHSVEEVQQTGTVEGDESDPRASIEERTTEIKLESKEDVDSAGDDQSLVAGQEASVEASDASAFKETPDTTQTPLEEHETSQATDRGDTTFQAMPTQQQTSLTQESSSSVSVQGTAGATLSPASREGAVSGDEGDTYHPQKQADGDHADRLDEDGGEALADGEDAKKDGSKHSAADQEKAKQASAEAETSSVSISTQQDSFNVVDFDRKTIVHEKHEVITSTHTEMYSEIKGSGIATSSVHQSESTQEDVIISKTFTLSESSAKLLTEPEVVETRTQSIVSHSVAGEHESGTPKIEHQSIESQVISNLDQAAMGEGEKDRSEYAEASVTGGQATEHQQESISHSDLPEEQVQGTGGADQQSVVAKVQPDVQHHEGKSEVADSESVLQFQDQGQVIVIKTDAVMAPLAVKEPDDEVEEENLLVNGVREDLMEASSPEISTCDQARADVSIATPVPGQQKGVTDDTDDDALNDDDMGIGAGDAAEKEELHIEEVEESYSDSVFTSGGDFEIERSVETMETPERPQIHREHRGEDGSVAADEAFSKQTYETETSQGDIEEEGDGTESSPPKARGVAALVKTPSLEVNYDSDPPDQLQSFEKGEEFQEQESGASLAGGTSQGPVTSDTAGSLTDVDTRDTAFKIDRAPVAMEESTEISLATELTPAESETEEAHSKDVSCSSSPAKTLATEKETDMHSSDSVRQSEFVNQADEKFATEGEVHTDDDSHLTPGSVSQDAVDTQDDDIPVSIAPFKDDQGKTEESQMYDGERNTQLQAADSLEELSEPISATAYVNTKDSHTAAADQQEPQVVNQVNDSSQATPVSKEETGTSAVVAGDELKELTSSTESFGTTSAALSGDAHDEHRNDISGEKSESFHSKEDMSLKETPSPVSKVQPQISDNVTKVNGEPLEGSSQIDDKV